MNANPIQPNRRRYWRFLASYLVEYDIHDKHAAAFMGNLSLGGMLLRGPSDLVLGDQTLFLLFLEGKDPIPIFGVVKAKHNKGVGIQFLPSQPEALQKLYAFVGNFVVPKLRQAIESGRSSVSRVVELAGLLGELGWKEDARRTYEQGLKTHPGSEELAAGLSGLLKDEPVGPSDLAREHSQLLADNLGTAASGMSLPLPIEINTSVATQTGMAAALVALRKELEREYQNKLEAAISKIKAELEAQYRQKAAPNVLGDQAAAAGQPSGVGPTEEKSASDEQNSIHLALARFSQNSELFSLVDPYGLKRLADIGVRQRNPSNQIIIRQGEQGDSFYLLCTGAVRILLEDETGSKEVARLGPGSFFGEIAVMTQQPRSATVETTEAAELIRFDRAPVLEVLNDYPRFKEMLSAVGLQRTEKNIQLELTGDLQAAVAPSAEPSPAKTLKDDKPELSLAIDYDPPESAGSQKVTALDNPEAEAASQPEAAEPDLPQNFKRFAWPAFNLKNWLVGAAVFVGAAAVLVVRTYWPEINTISQEQTFKPEQTFREPSSKPDNLAANRPTEEDSLPETKTLQTETAIEPDKAAQTDTAIEKTAPNPPSGAALELNSLAQKYLDSGHKLLEKKRYVLAIEEYKKASNLNPTDGSIHRSLGIAYTLARRPEEAVKEYKLYLKLVPTAPEKMQLEQMIADFENGN